jgi:hypothetical protein
MQVLNEWKVQMFWNWFYMTHLEAIADGSEFMCADLVSAENKAFSVRLSHSSFFQYNLIRIER